MNDSNVIGTLLIIINAIGCIASFSVGIFTGNLWLVVYASIQGSVAYGILEMMERHRDELDQAFNDGFHHHHKVSEDLDKGVAH